MWLGWVCLRGTMGVHWTDGHVMVLYQGTLMSAGNRVGPPLGGGPIKPPSSGASGGGAGAQGWLGGMGVGKDPVCCLEWLIANGWHGRQCMALICGTHDDSGHPCHGTNPFQSAPTERPCLVLSGSALGKVPLLCVAESAARKREPRHPGALCIWGCFAMHQHSDGVASHGCTEEGLCCLWQVSCGPQAESLHAAEWRPPTIAFVIVCS